jgi:hypothetical protein
MSIPSRGVGRPPGTTPRRPASTSSRSFAIPKVSVLDPSLTPAVGRKRPRWEQRPPVLRQVTPCCGRVKCFYGSQGMPCHWRAITLGQTRYVADSRGRDYQHVRAVAAHGCTVPKLTVGRRRSPHLVRKAPRNGLQRCEMTRGVPAGQQWFAEARPPLQLDLIIPRSRSYWGGARSATPSGIRWRGRSQRGRCEWSPPFQAESLRSRQL